MLSLIKKSRDKCYIRISRINKYREFDSLFYKSNQKRIVQDLPLFYVNPLSLIGYSPAKFSKKKQSASNLKVTRVSYSISLENSLNWKSFSYDDSLKHHGEGNVDMKNINVPLWSI